MIHKVRTLARHVKGCIVEVDWEGRAGSAFLNLHLVIALQFARNDI